MWELILHDHCYTCLSRGETSADGSHPEVKHRKKFIRDVSGGNDMIDGLPEGYVTNDVDQSNHSEEGTNSSAKRKLSLSEPTSNGPSPKSRKSNKIHELLFGECDDPQYVDGVQIPDTQTVASDEGKSITTSDFGLYINNPSTYSNISSEEAKTFLTGSERLTLFGNSMSVDSETEILEAASTLMDLSRKSLEIPKYEHRSLKKNRIKPEKLKRTNNVLKPKPTDIKAQKRKYTKRKGSKKDNVKETYSLWTNGNKYDEFEYYATKPLHRSQCTLSSRKSSYRRSQESKGEKKKDGDEVTLNGDVKEENIDVNSDSPHIKLTEPERSVSVQKVKPKRRKPSKLNPSNAELESGSLFEDKKSVTQRKSSSKTEIKEEEDEEKQLLEVIPPFPIASSSGAILPDGEMQDYKHYLAEAEAQKENGVDSEGETDESKYPHPHLMTRPIPRRGKRKSCGSDEDRVNSEDEAYIPIKFERCTDDEVAKSDPWGQLIPEPVLLKIFSMVVTEQGVAPFLARASSVCRLWHQVASEPRLWAVCDLSGPAVRKFKKTFHWLCRRRMTRTRRLNLANWEVLTCKEIELLGQHAPLIESLNLSRCSRITPSSLKTLIDNLEHLKHLDLSFATTFIASKFVLEQLIVKRGVQLETLNCSYNILVKFDAVMAGVIKSCRNLRVLDLSNAIFSSCLLPLNIEQLQIGCPLLKKLLMANSLFKAKPVWGASPGFLHLEELNVARSAVSHLSKFRYVDDNVLHRFLRTSAKLRVLDVSGCRYVSNTGLQELAIPNLQSLSLSYCRASLQREIQTTILRWSHSLTELDFSGNSVNDQLIRCILEKCTKLEHLNLSGCKGLPWDKRHEFNGQELVKLRETMDSWLTS